MPLSATGRPCHAGLMLQPSANENPKPERRWAPALAFLIGVGALVAFIVLNRMMAPPFPNFSRTNAAPESATSPVSNAPAQSAK